MSIGLPAENAELKNRAPRRLRPARREEMESAIGLLHVTYANN